MDFDKLALTPQGTFLYIELKGNSYVYSIFKEVTDDGVCTFADYFTSSGNLFSDSEDALLCSLDRIVSFRECNPEEIQLFKQVLYERSKKIFVNNQLIDMNEFNPQVQELNMAIIDEEMKKLYKQLVVAERLKNERINVNAENQLIADHFIDNQVRIDNDIDINEEPVKDFVYAGDGILEQIKVQGDIIQAVNEVDKKVFNQELNDNGPVKLKVEADFNEINEQLRRAVIGKYNFKPELRLGDPIKVRNSENDSWESKFFACKETLSTGEKKIKTTDGKLWNYIK
jgi:hypothetical protein